MLCGEEVVADLAANLLVAGDTRWQPDHPWDGPYIHAQSRAHPAQLPSALHRPLFAFGQDRINSANRLTLST